MPLSVHQQIVVIRLESGAMLRAMEALHEHIARLPVPTRIVEMVANPDPLSLPIAHSFELAVVLEFDGPVNPDDRFYPLVNIALAR